MSDAKNPETGSGYMVLAMGKMGAHELNYSSDIDLMVFFKGANPALTDGAQATLFFTRLTRELVKLLQERTADGYGFASIYGCDLIHLRPRLQYRRTRR